MEDKIKHLAVVEFVDEHKVRVRVLQKAACSSCSAKGHCNSSEVKEKYFDIPNTTGEAYEVGQRVMCCINSSSGLKAVFLAFLLPFVFMFIGLLLCIYAWDTGEAVAALVSLGILAVYYTLLYIGRGWLGKNFSLTLERLSE